MVRSNPPSPKLNTYFTIRTEFPFSPPPPPLTMLRGRGEHFKEIFERLLCERPDTNIVRGGAGSSAEGRSQQLPHARIDLSSCQDAGKEDYRRSSWNFHGAPNILRGRGGDSKFTGEYRTRYFVSTRVDCHEPHLSRRKQLAGVIIGHKHAWISIARRPP